MNVHAPSLRWRFAALLLATTSPAWPVNFVPPDQVASDPIIIKAQYDLANNKKLAADLFISEGDTFVPTRILVDPDGSKAIAFDRLHFGLPVTYEGVGIQYNPNGTIRDSDTPLVEPIAISSVKPSASAGEAASFAQKKYPQLKQVHSPKLLIFQDPSHPHAKLAWEVILHGNKDGKTTHLHVFVSPDASDEIATDDDVIVDGLGAPSPPNSRAQNLAPKIPLVPASGASYTDAPGTGKTF